MNAIWYWAVSVTAISNWSCWRGVSLIVPILVDFFQIYADLSDLFWVLLSELKGDLCWTTPCWTILECRRQSNPVDDSKAPASLTACDPGTRWDDEAGLLRLVSTELFFKGWQPGQRKVLPLLQLGYRWHEGHAGKWILRTSTGWRARLKVFRPPLPM